MITLITAYINAKYDYGYEALFIGTVIIDICLIVFLGGGSS
jgi:hypothetical protein